MNLHQLHYDAMRLHATLGAIRELASGEQNNNELITQKINAVIDKTRLIAVKCRAALKERESTWEDVER